MELQPSVSRLHHKKMMKQLTDKCNNSPLQSAARGGNIILVKEILSGTASEVEEFRELLSKQNQSGETALYIAAMYGYVVVKKVVNYYDLVTESIKARNGFDPFHIAAKKGDLELLKVLLEALPDLSMTSYVSNTTALHTSATQGHIKVVHLLLECGSSLVVTFHGEC